MKTLLQGMRICQYQLRVLSRNYKIYTVPVCMLIYMRNTMIPLRQLLTSVNENAVPCLLPFLFNDGLLTALMFAGVLLFYTDAPFYDSHQLFVVMRSGVSRWCLGQALYVISVSVGYMCFLTAMSVVVLLPQITFSGEWGRVWTTLAYSDAGYESGLVFGVSANILKHYSPWTAVCTAFFLGFLLCCFYGFCMWCLNLYLGKIVSLVIVLASVCLVTRVQFFPSWVVYLVPDAWVDLAYLSEYAPHGITVSRAVFLLVTGILCLAALALWKTSRSDIAK